ncbi:MAG: glycosyltransferase [Bacteroidota bacterium]
MKIIMVIDSLRKGGKERRMVELLKGLDKISDVQCELVILAEHVYFSQIYEMDIKVHVIENANRKYVRTVSQLKQIFSAFMPDLVHSWGTMSSIYALPMAKMVKAKFINGMISNAPASVGLLDKTMIRSKLTFPFSDVVIANSKAGLASYKAPEAKSYCFYNGFDFKRIKELENPHFVREKFDIKTEYIVGMVGAFEDRKDYDTYLKAAMEICLQRDDVTFVSVGGGNNLQRSEDMIPTSLKERIIFTGLQSNVEDIVNTFTIGVLSTDPRVHGEGVSNAIMEYMAMGKPVVASDTGGTKEIVMNGQTGFIVEGRNIQQFVEKISWLLDHPERAVEMGRAGKERVENIFNLDLMVDNYMKLYEDLMRSN